MRKVWLNAYEKGIPGQLEYPDTTLPAALAQIASEFPNNHALVYLDYSWSYSELDKLVSQMANLLIGMGIKPGERIAIHLPNSPQFVIAYYGLLRAGAIAVPINPSSTGDDFEFILENSGSKILVTFSDILPNLKLDAAIGIKILVTHIQTPFAPNQDYQISPVPSVTRLERVLFDQSTINPGIMISPDAYANLQYTGGTTGRSKGAILSHRNLIANACQFKHWFKNSYNQGEGRFIGVIPLFHIYAMTTTMNAPIITASTILLQSKFDISELMHIIERYKPNLFMGVPAMYGAITLRQQHPDMSSIKACMSGSAPLPPAIQKNFEYLTGGKLAEGYGLSEASPIVCCNPIYGNVKNGSIGLPFPDTDVRIVDPQTGTDVKPGEVGELIVKGPQVMQGYWEQPEETALVLHNGWLHTGDLVWMDEEGYVYIADRLKDLIITGGEKIYPKEVEDLLYTHPAVKEAAVIGVPHPLRGEVPQAYIVVKDGHKPGERELRQFCAAHLTKYKVPHGFKFVDSLPRNSMGKILKRVLRQSA